MRKILSFYSILCSSEGTRGAVGWNCTSGRNIGARFAESIAKSTETAEEPPDRETVIDRTGPAAVQRSGKIAISA
ncbi:hypothetical protein RFN28_08810 [Mesorhizobium sp. VK24D]|uniref:Secreted protein n=1 Tax=Mesorhizobium album TaxID=3072314 RepID=A0ABU4XVY1_9HYPH|nr:hypothetical protein [Mesorhizobium sp. VK24D]MDX8478581.1 hypothetical protein [Mesorhizobium sp. VK24D]